MKITLRMMSEKEFEAYSDYSINDYANDLLKSSEMTKEEALLQAKKEFYETLPDGPHTKNNRIMVIEGLQDARPVGVIWYLFEWTEGVKQVFLNDFIIKQEERRKGYATAALQEMERDAQTNGCTESITYVWKHNPTGIKLYSKCGYTTFRELDDGMYMKKECRLGQ